MFIPKGSTKGIITYLESKGYSLNKYDAYLLYLIGNPQSGWIEIPSQYIESTFSDSYFDTHSYDVLLDSYHQDIPQTHFEITITKAHFLHAITSAKSATKSITLIPGETSYFLLQDIARIFSFDVEELEKIYTNYAPYNDGVILADTYNLPYHASPEFIIQYLINQSLRKHEQLANELLGYYDEIEWFGYIAKASIIQKEAANISEMPLVSSVIDNRIAKKMPLQMDGSLNYGKYSHSKITPKRIREDTTEFNTYKHIGIPRTPSGSVSIEAIKAAISPANTNYLYFMRNTNGTHDFTHSYQEHLKNIKRVKN